MRYVFWSVLLFMAMVLVGATVQTITGGLINGWWVVIGLIIFFVASVTHGAPHRDEPRTYENPYGCSRPWEVNVEPSTPSGYVAHVQWGDHIRTAAWRPTPRAAIKASWWKAIKTHDSGQWQPGSSEGGGAQ